MATKRIEHPSVIEHGGDAHRALLGIDQTEDAVAKEKLEQALVKPPVVSTKQPITSDNYRPQTTRSTGDAIFDGWHRMGR